MICNTAKQYCKGHRTCQVPFASGANLVLKKPPFRCGLPREMTCAIQFGVAVN